MSTRERLQETFKFALSMMLAYWLALALDWDLPKYAGLAVVLVSLDSAGASLNKGLARVVGTVVGVIAAWVLIGSFFQERWAFAAALTVYLAFCAYCMQRSKVPYAWFVGGFVATVVWSNSVNDVGNAFRFGVFRFLETASGVLIYTLVATILRPRRAGGRVAAQGAKFWSDAHRSLAASRATLAGGEPDVDPSVIEGQLAGAIPTLTNSIRAAYGDTDAIKARKPSWETVPPQLQRVVIALVSCRLAVEDVVAAGAQAYTSALTPAVDAIDRRLARIDAGWARAVQPRAATAADADDTESRIEVPPCTGSDAPLAARVALASLSGRVAELEAASRGIAETLTFTKPREPANAASARPPLVDTKRLGLAVLPALSFFLAFVLWVLTVPPGGAGVPQLAATIGLATLNLPARSLLGPTLKSLFLGLVLVAPIYFVVMPWLDGGPAILLVVFAFSALFGWLGATKPGLRFGAMLIFTMTTGISNQQSYSFYTFSNFAVMALLGFGVVMLVFWVFAPQRAEIILSQHVRQFFAACARTVETPTGAAAAQLAPALRGARTAQKHLDPGIAPSNTPERVNRLLGAMQALALRLRALDADRTRWRRADREVDAALASSLQQVGSGLQRTLGDLSRHDAGAALCAADDALDAGREVLSEDVERAAAEYDAEAKRDGFAVLGGARGVVAVTKDACAASADIDWDAWEAARF